MTGIDVKMSQDNATAITAKGWRYIEAQLQGSQRLVDEKRIIVLGAGDRSLYIDCQSCFVSICRNCIFLGDVGNSCKMFLVLQLISGISLVGLTEGLQLGMAILGVTTL